MVQLSPFCAVAATIVSLLLNIHVVHAQYGNDDSSNTGTTLNCAFPSTPMDLRSDGGSLLLSHIVNQVDQTVTVKLEYDGLGWIGMAYVKEEKMINSTAVVGLPDTGVVAKYDLIGKGPDEQVGADATRQRLTATSVTQQDGKTILAFTKPLVDGPEFPVAIGEITVMWAVGSTNDFEYHAARGSMVTTLTQCLEGGQTNAPVAPVAPVPVPTSAPVMSPTNSGSNVVDLGQGRTQISVTSLEKVSSLTLTTDEAAGTLTVEMVVAQTAWIGFGFSRDGNMQNSVGAVFFPADDGTGAPRKWDLGDTSITESQSSSQTLMDATALQNDTHTVMKFTKLLVEGDETPVTLQGSNSFLYAIGSDNDFGIHSFRRSFTFDFANAGSAIVAAGAGNKGLWRTHGILMALAWAILVPLGIGASILRKILPLPDGMWFQVHRGLNSLGLLFTIAGFAIAVYLIGDEGGDSAKHFQTVRHRKVGLTVFLFAIVQALSGIFRPHLPPKPSEKLAPVVESELYVDNSHEHTLQPDDKAKPSTEKSKARIFFEYQHRILGTVTMILAWYNSDSGIKQFNQRFQGSEVGIWILWIVVAVITLTTLILATIQNRRKS